MLIKCSVHCDQEQNKVPSRLTLMRGRSERRAGVANRSIKRSDGICIRVAVFAEWKKKRVRAKRCNQEHRCANRPNPVSSFLFSTALCSLSTGQNYAPLAAICNNNSERKRFSGFAHIAARRLLQSTALLLRTITQKERKGETVT